MLDVLLLVMGIDLTVLSVYVVGYDVGVAICEICVSE